MAKQKTFKVTTPKFRVSYPHLFEPRLNTLSGKEEYSVQAIFPPDADLSELKAAAKKALKAEFGEDITKWPVPPDQMRLPFKVQAAKKDQDGILRLPPGFTEGAPLMTYKCSPEYPPVIVGTERDMSGNLVRLTEPRDVYGGCYARAAIAVKAYSHGANRGVTCYLNSLQKLDEGEPFGNISRPEDDFAPVAGQDDQQGDATSIFG